MPSMNDDVPARDEEGQASFYAEKTAQSLYAQLGFAQDARTAIIELEAERCSLYSLGAFTDEHYCGPAVTRVCTAMIRTYKCGLDRDSEQSSSPYLFKSSQGSKRQESEDVAACSSVVAH